MTDVFIRIRPADVKAEAGRRILARYPAHKQANVDRAGGGGQAEMTAFIDRIRAASDSLEAMSPIPMDFSDDRWWD